MLHAMSVDRACQYHVDVGEPSLVSLVSHDLLWVVPGVELLVATADGTLLCLTAGNATTASADELAELRLWNKVTKWPTQLRAHNDFVFTDTVSLRGYLINEFGFSFTVKRVSDSFGKSLCPV